MINRSMTRFINFAALTGLVLVAAGCSWTDKGGTHHLIVGIGFGVITTTNAPGVSVYESHVLGGELGPDFAGLGWMQHHQVQIDPALASNVVVSIKSTGLDASIKNFDPYQTNRIATTNLNTNQPAKN